MECAVKLFELELFQGFDWDGIAKAEAMKQRVLKVVDDLYEEDSQSKDFLNLVISGRHRKLYLLVSKHNLNQKSK